METLAEKEGNLSEKVSGLLLSRRHDYQFLFGDMNFRCDLACADAKDLAHANNIKALVESDQLRKVIGQDPLLSRFQEKNIEFLPSYKYDKNSTVYDTSKKQRTPSYTDRILFSVNTGSKKLNQGCDIGNEMECEYYNRCETTFSDHRPVLAILSAKVRKINTEQHAAAEKEMLEKILSGTAPASKDIQLTEAVQSTAKAPYTGGAQAQDQYTRPSWYPQEQNPQA